MWYGKFSNRFGGKGVQAEKRKAVVAALRKAVEEGKLPKADPAVYARTAFRAATAAFMRARGQNRRGQ